MAILLGLGSNKGNRKSYIKQALNEIAKIANIKNISDYYYSKALLPENAPLDWDMDFVNIVISCESGLSPRDLLIKIKEIEIKIGRNYTGFWGPREIDIDILNYHTIIINEPDLIIPHPQMLKRDFVMVPLRQVTDLYISPKA